MTLLGFTFERAPEPPPFPLKLISLPWVLPDLYREMQSADAEKSSRATKVLARGTEEPWFVSFYDSPAMERALENALQARFDLIWLEDTDMARFMRCLPSDVPKVLDFHNVYSVMARRAAESATCTKRAELQWEAERTLRFERRVAQQCQLAVVCSVTEAAAARELLGVTRIDVIPNGVDTCYYLPSCLEERDKRLLFTGTMNHPPNEEALLYLARDILPRIRRMVPNVELHVAGKDPTPRVRALAAQGVVIHGAVPDMQPYFAAASVVVAPILSGGGTRLKILEAAACSKAIVSTTLGAEGLDLHHQEHLLIADSPEAFADSVVHLLREPATRRRLGGRAREASLRFDWTHIELKTAATVSSFSSGK